MIRVERMPGHKRAWNIFINDKLLFQRRWVSRDAALAHGRRMVELGMHLEPKPVLAAAYVRKIEPTKDHRPLGPIRENVKYRY